MNYLAHGYRFVDQPYLLAGTAVPDWLSAVDRRLRARAAAAQKWLADPDPRLAAVARGIVQHHHDDRWFHQSRAFVELSLHLTLAVRQVLPHDEGFRPSFLGHILVELLLDATLIEEQPGRLEAYYQALRQTTPQVLAEAVTRISGRPADALAEFIRRFSAERFLADYGQDDPLLGRLNRVMHRVHLPPLPESFQTLLPEARRQVRRRRHELLAGESHPASAALIPSQGESS